MNSKSLRARIGYRLLAVFVSVAVIISMMPAAGLSGTDVYGAEGGLKIETPELAVTGTDVIGGKTYTADNIDLEKSYTRGELKKLEGGKEILYSSINTFDTKKYYKATGVYIKSLLKGTAFDAGKDTLTVLASDGYSCSFNPQAKYSNGSKDTTGLNEARYFYPGLAEGSSDGAVKVETMIAWDYSEGAKTPEKADRKDFKKVITGQLNIEDKNNPVYNGGKCDVSKVIGGKALEEKVLKIGSREYTRADVMLMKRADNTYTYTTKKGTFTDYVRGVPLSELLAGSKDKDVVTFGTADNYINFDANGMTVGDLIKNDYILAYEKGESKETLKGIYEASKDDASVSGCFVLYGNGASPVKLVNSIEITGTSGIDFSFSPFKHITNGGIKDQDGPYNVDGITGATLTIEGPGVKNSVPLSVGDMESQDKGCARGNYTDLRNGKKTERTYEGVDLYYLLHNMEDGVNGIILTDRAKKVEIKNRNRNTIATISLETIEKMHNEGTPILIAYGTSYTDGKNTRPFVFDDGAAGQDSELGNTDGCLKLVCDADKMGIASEYATFGNMAYIYVCEGDEPGYKHDKAPYKTAENSQYVLTITGSEIGREVNYTVQQLEDMVKYDENGRPVKNGIGYRDEYSLANSSYWYVDEYEGVKLWDLLKKSGIPDSKKTDDKTKVTFTATDGYKGFDSFSLKQIADPDCFGYYEKNIADVTGADYKGAPGDLKKTGYPVLVAYGVNRYPYVIKNTLDGFLSGLSNDGGPLRVISGKMNYTHANGSNQAKLLDKIIVGDDTYHYSTHKYSDKKIYNDLGSKTKLNVRVYSGTGKSAVKLSSDKYTAADIEEIIYGGTLTSAELAEAKIKAFYEAGKAGSKYNNDLYEGMDIAYLLQKIVKLQGAKGTVTFSNGKDKLQVDLKELLTMTKGYNSETGLKNLRPILAYAKNGSPLVKSSSSAGYEDTVTLGEAEKTKVKNSGGPLQVVIPRTSKGKAPRTLKNVTSITVNLAADKYAHVKTPYSSYKKKTVIISGEGTRISGKKKFTVSDIEGRQTLARTYTYSFRNSKGKTYQRTYRGISLYDFLNSTDIGLKTSADKVVITTTDGKKKTFTLSEIRKGYMNSKTGKKNLPVILAYGSAPAKNKETGKPLVTSKKSKGYSSKYGNDGGPIRLVIGQTSKKNVNLGKCLSRVKSIEVTSSESVSWNHSSSEVFKQYLDNKVAVQVVDNDNKELFAKDCTVKEIEAMTSLIEKEDITTTAVNSWEGVNFWKFIKQNTTGVTGLDDPISITVTAKDGYSAEIKAKFGMDAIKNGIKDGERRVPIILAYGMDGYPLAAGGKSTPKGPGYDSVVGNEGGPIRLVTHNSQGASVSEVTQIVIKVGNGSVIEDDNTEKDFNIYGMDKTKTFDIRGLKNSGAASGVVEGTYTSRQGTSHVRGIYLAEILNASGITDEAAVIDITTTDGFAPEDYKGITLKEIKEQKYLVAYDESSDGGKSWTAIKDTSKDGKTSATVRLYRNYDDGSARYNRIDCVKGVTVNTAAKLSSFAAVPLKTEAAKEKIEIIPTDGSEGNLPLAGIRSVSADKNGGLWVGTYGGGAAYRASDAETFSRYNKNSTPALETTFVSAIAADGDGGVWLSQNASYTDPANNRGLIYMKGGKAEYFLETDKPATIPNNYVQEIQIDNDGTVWIGSFGGLTKYQPKENKWTTYDKNDGFPAMSVDNITLDGNGGAWCGFYPDGKGTQEDPFTGGFAYIDASGKITKYSYTADFDKAAGSSKLAQVWIRDIAIDKNGGAWIVASGSYANMENTGGTVWYVSEPGAEAVKYTGDRLFGKALDGATNAEVRMVMASADGSLWFGTSADGVLYIKKPAVRNGKMTVTAELSSETGMWTEKSMNNVYSLDKIGDKIYIGTSAGLAVVDFPEYISSMLEQKIKITARKASKKTVKLNWNKVKTADGYDVYRASKKSGRYIKVKSVSSNTCTDKKLKRGKTCYYKVRAYSKVNGKKLYGGFSAVKKITVK